MDGKIYKVFVSSTYEDLREERAAVQKALLQLDCLPVGMELFPAADDETWDFIKTQIDDADYYVVVIAGRYGSAAPDGISFTEKEYDYALEKKKPSIGFVHGDPGAIAVARAERTEEARAKLNAFLNKVKQRPVRTFTSPHQLALEVTTSFVKLIRERPAEGYVRFGEAVEFKRYAEVLEENNRLKEQMKLLENSLDTAPFKGFDRQVALKVAVFRSAAQGRQERRTDEIKPTLAQIFVAVAEAIIQNDEQGQVLFHSARALRDNLPDGWTANEFDQTSTATIRRLLVLYGLIEILRVTVTGAVSSGTIFVWRLTDFGRRQLRIIASE